MGLVLPGVFIDRMKDDLKEDASDFFDALQTDPPVSIRKNPIRKYSEELPIESFIPWEADAYYLEERPSFTYDPSFHAGAYYVQEASSMLIGFIVDQIKEKNTWELAIDLCAAPGGKTTHLLSKLSKKVFVLANEVTSARLGALRQNVIKWGHSNAAVINYPVETIINTGIEADLVLIDAPCSGEGLFRKEHDAVDHWTPENLNKCEVRQKDILSNAKSLVKNGGYLIYSTCTYNSGENQLQVESLVNSGYFESIEINFEESFGIHQITSTENYCYQCYPHKVRGEGFFVSLLRRTEKEYTSSGSSSYKPKSNFLPLSDDAAALLPDFFLSYHEEIQIDKEGNIFYTPIALQDLQHYMNIRPIFELGVMKGKDFVPAHGLAMLPEFKDAYPVVNLSKDQAIKFLKKDSFSVENYDKKGWHFASYLGNNIGLVKVLENRINNYLPVNLRILK